MGEIESLSVPVGPHFVFLTDVDLITDAE